MGTPADTRPIVLVGEKMHNHPYAKALGVYFRGKNSKGLTADFLFPGVRHVGTLAAIVIDLRQWDSSDALFEHIEDLQQEEISFQERLSMIRAKFRCSIALVIVDGQNSRQRFNRIQTSIDEKWAPSDGNASKLMLLAIDNPHGIGNELAELRNSFQES